MAPATQLKNYRVDFPSLLLAAHRLLAASDSFLRPSGVNRLSRFELPLVRWDALEAALRSARLVLLEAVVAVELEAVRFDC